MKKENLIIGDYLYLRNGEVMILGRHGTLYDMKSNDLKVENPIVSLSGLNDYLEHNGGIHAYDVIRVDRLKPCFGNTRLMLETIWKRNDETKEMTLDEISKELGYNVKIIKGW